MSSVEREWSRLLCTEESLDSSPEAGPSRVQPSLLCTEGGFDSSPEAGPSRVQPSLLCTETSFRSRSPLRSSPGLSVYMPGRATTPVSLSTLMCTAGGACSRRQPIELNEDSLTILRLRQEYEDNQRWLLQRNILPYEVDVSRPVFQDSDMDVEELTTPSPFKEKYNIRRQLGKGVDGSVYEVEDRLSGEIYAAKITYANRELRMSDDIMTMEARIMVALEDVRGIPKVISLFHENEMTIATRLAAPSSVSTGSRLIQPSAVLVMTTPEPPYSTLASLRTTGMESNRIREIFSSLIGILKKMDDHDIAHNDLHSGNVLVSGTDVTLIDFGRSEFKTIPYDMNWIITYAQPNKQQEIANKYKFEFRKMYDYDRQTVWRVAMMLFESYGGIIYDESIRHDLKDTIHYPSRMPRIVMALLNRVFIPYTKRINIHDFFNYDFFNMSIPLSRR